MRLRDGKADFGWISIGLHWIGATVVIALLFIGNSIHALGGGVQDKYLWLHTSIALSAAPFLAYRIWWRFSRRHPERLPKQKPIYYAIGKPFHYLLLGAIALMLLSGPLMAWSGGLPLRLWIVEIPSPFGVNATLYGLFRAAHITGATLLGWGTLLHILAVAKHVIIDKDGAFDRMMAPHEKG